MRIRSVLATLTVATLALTGCTSGGSSPSGNSSQGIIITNTTEPQTGFIPPMINEVGGGRVATMLFSGLVYYDKDGKIQNEIAKSIETKDSKVFTVKLNEGWKFSNGEAVTSESFVDAWQWGAKLSNKALSREFFSPIEGYSDDKDTELTGLKVVSPTEFTITLSSPQSDFPNRLGYTAYYPMPKDAFKDMKAFGEKPIGNGPYTLNKWEHNVKLELRPNKDYNGPRKAQNGGIDFKVYEQETAAYNDLLSGSLDVLETIPAESLTSFEKDLGKRAINVPGALFQSFSIPGYLPHFAYDEEGKLRRQAISMAINREEITKTIFNGTRSPASDFVSPVIPGHTKDLENAKYLKFDAAKAKELWEKANAIKPWDGTFELAYNSDGPHKEWVEAVCNQIKNTLGIEAKPKPYAAFKELRKEASEGKLTSALRTGWQADYPSAYNFLGPLYRKSAGSNDGRYDNPKFEELLDKGLSAANADEAGKLFSEAQNMILEDLPAIPLWYQNTLGGYSEHVSDVIFSWNTEPLYYQVKKQG